MNHRIAKAGLFLRFVLVSRHNIPFYALLLFVAGAFALEQLDLDILLWPLLGFMVIAVYWVSRALYKPQDDGEPRSSWLQMTSTWVVAIGFGALISLAFVFVIVIAANLGLGDLIIPTLTTITIIWLLMFLRRRWREFNTESGVALPDGD